MILLYVEYVIDLNHANYLRVTELLASEYIVKEIKNCTYIIINPSKQNIDNTIPNHMTN